jgi:hypothetical protein
VKALLPEGHAEHYYHPGLGILYQSGGEAGVLALYDRDVRRGHAPRREVLRHRHGPK